MLMGRKRILDSLTPEQQEAIAKEVLSRKAKAVWARMTPEQRKAHTETARRTANAKRKKGTEAERQRTAAAREAMLRNAAERAAKKKAAEKKAAS